MSREDSLFFLFRVEWMALGIGWRKGGEQKETEKFIDDLLTKKFN
jgi:hypothetical protein